jgi:hypothetical protein
MGKYLLLSIDGSCHLSCCIPTKRPPLIGEVSAKFADRGCRVVNTTDPYGRIIGFLDRKCYFSSK